MARSPTKHTASRDEAPPARRFWHEIAWVLIAPALLYLALSLFSYSPDDKSWSHTGSLTGVLHNYGGTAGAWIADIAFYFCGYVAYTLPLVIGGLLWIALFDRDGEHESGLTPALRLIGIVAFLISAAGLAHLHWGTVAGLPAEGGGILGNAVGNGLDKLFGGFGANLFLAALLLVALTLATGISWFAVMDAVGAGTLATIAWIGGLFGRGVRSAGEWNQARAARVEREEVRKVDSQRRARREPMKIEPPPKPVIEKSERAKREQQIPLFNVDPVGGKPPLSLLDDAKPQPKSYSEETLETLSRQIEFKLKDFRIDVSVVGAYPGPVITRFEMEPAPGVKVSQISSLDKDIARGLSVKSVRVVDVIPGKSVIGIEIPNSQRETIYLAEILDSKEYDKSSSPLTLALGKTINGSPAVVDLARMPHLLVAGTTGAGKSVGLNAMVLSLLFKAGPQDVKLLMIDPKMLELSVYEGIPHLSAPVVTDMKQASNVLRWCVGEMERRYKLMAAVGVRNLGGFNKKVLEASERGQPLLDPLFRAEPGANPAPPQLQTLPNIVVIIDEFADMMMIVGKKVEELIARLAQKSRAAGIHLILATQRPSVDVITGLIKANIPTRIAFQVSSKIDSRTILDQSGAETLLGHGDMLYLPPGTALPERVHGAFVSDDEVHRVVDYLKRHSGGPNYIDGILDDVQPMGEGTVVGPSGLPESGGAGDESDALYDEAVRIVTETRRASISGVQRRLKIGYNRAARLIEAMEAAGVVTPPEHNGDRSVLAPPPPKN